MSLLFTDVLVYDRTAPAGYVGPTDVLVEGNRITAIGPRVQGARADRVIRGDAHRLLVPGLVNAHFHSPANHLRGSVRSLPLELFMLQESPSDPSLTPTAHEAYVRTMLAAVEMLQRGITSVQDDAFLMPTPDPAIIDAVAQAYVDSGIRATLALDQPELPEKDKLPFISDDAPELADYLAKPPAAGADELLAAYDHLISRWHGRDRVRAAVSVSAPQRVSPAYFAALQTLADKHDLAVYAHMLETRTQAALTTHPRFHNRSIVRYTDELGLLTERTNVIHAVWVSDDDLDRIAAAKATIAHNPVSNLRLGSGVMPWRDVLRPRHPRRARHRRGDLRRHREHLDRRQDRGPDPQRLRPRPARLARRARGAGRAVARWRPRSATGRAARRDRGRHARGPHPGRAALAAVHAAQRPARAARLRRGRAGT